MVRAAWLSSGCRVVGSVTAAATVTPTAATDYTADVISDMFNRHITPNVSNVSLPHCSAAHPPMSWIHISGNSVPRKF